METQIENQSAAKDAQFDAVVSSLEPNSRKSIDKPAQSIFKSNDPSIVNNLEQNITPLPNSQSTMIRSRISEIILSYSTRLYEDEMKTIKNLNEEDYIPNSKIIESYPSTQNQKNDKPKPSERSLAKKNTACLDQQSKKTIESSRVLISNGDQQEQLEVFKFRNPETSPEKYLKAFSRFALHQYLILQIHKFQVIYEQENSITIKKSTAKSMGQIIVGCLITMGALILELRFNPANHSLILSILEGSKKSVNKFLTSIKQCLWTIGGIECKPADRLNRFLNSQGKTFTGFNKTCKSDYRRADNKEKQLQKCFNSAIHLKSLLFLKMKISGFFSTGESEEEVQVEARVLDRTCLWELYKSHYSEVDYRFNTKRKSIRQKLLPENCQKLLQVKRSSVSDKCWAEAETELLQVQKHFNPFNKLQYFQRFLDTLSKNQDRVEEGTSVPKKPDLIALIVLAFLYSEASNIQSSIKFAQVYCSVQELDDQYAKVALLNVSADYIQDCWTF